MGATVRLQASLASQCLDDVEPGHPSPLVEKQNKNNNQKSNTARRDRCANGAQYANKPHVSGGQGTRGKKRREFVVGDVKTARRGTPMSR